jgi:hypothetical protein
VCEKEHSLPNTFALLQSVVHPALTSGLVVPHTTPM